MEPFLAQIIMFGGNFAPRGWAFCNGQLLAISQNQALFSLLGTTYGGDGRTTFALPDLRGRVPMHAGTGPGLSTRKIGQRFGTQTNTQTINQMANHHHTGISSGAGSIGGTATATSVATVNANNGTADGPEPQDGFMGVNDGGNIYAAASDGTTMNADFVQVATAVNTAGLTLNLAGAVTGSTGAQQPMNNIQPCEVINFIIAMQGTFPSRN